MNYTLNLKKLHNKFFVKNGKPQTKNGILKKNCNFGIWDRITNLMILKGIIV